MINIKQKPSWYKIYIRGHIRAANEAFSMPWEHPIKSIMTIIALAICFYIPLLLWIVWLNYDDVKQNWIGQGSVAVFLQSGVEMDEASIFIQELRNKNMVESVLLVNKDKLYQELKSDDQLSQVIDLVSNHDLPDQILIKPKVQVTSIQLEMLVNELTVNPQVEYISYDQQWFSQLQAVTNTLLQLARLSAFIFIIIVMVFLGQIISSELNQHRNELRLLELIGASWSQIRRRFLYFGTIFGFFAGVVSILFLSFSLWWLKQPIQDLAQTYATEIEIQNLNFSLIISILFLATLITWLAARLSLSSKHSIMSQG
jgi:cell division transport system permease protein